MDYYLNEPFLEQGKALGLKITCLFLCLESFLSLLDLTNTNLNHI